MTAMHLPQILLIGTLALILLCTALILVKRLRLNEIRGVFGLHAETNKVALKLANTAGKAIENITNVAGNAERMVARSADTIDRVAGPLADGVGKVLNAISSLIQEKQAKARTLTAELINLTQENERLKARRIDVTSVTAQLKLALMQIDASYVSIKRSTIDSDKGTFLIGKPSKIEYLGVVQTAYKIQVGVDINRLTFALINDTLIAVHGTKEMEFIGVKDLKTESRICEVRRLYESKKDTTNQSATARYETGEIITDDRRTEHTILHLAEATAEAQSPERIKHLEEPNARFALSFLQACLSAGGFTVVASESPIVDGLRFDALCHRINQRLAATMTASDKRIKEVGEEVLLLEHDILNLANH